MTAKGETKRKNAYVRSQVRKKIEEATGGDTLAYYLEEDSEPFYIPHPLFFDDETSEALENSEDGDRGSQARILLGDQYERFVNEGGTNTDFNLFMYLVNKDLQASSGN